MSSPIRLFVPDNPILARTLRQKLELERNKLGQSIVLGFAADWPDYRERIGVIKGLNLAIELCLEAEKQLGD